MMFFSKKAIGIDIADHTIEIVALKKVRNNNFKVIGLARKIIRTGVIKNGQIINEDRLKQIFIDLLIDLDFRKNYTEEIVFGIPESLTYSFVFEIKEFNFEQIEQFVVEKIKENIPVNFEDLVYDYKLIKLSKEKNRLIIVATEKFFLRQWIVFFRKLGLEIKYFDFESLAVFNSLFIDRPQKPIMLVDFGSKTTDVFVFDKYGLVYSYTIPIAGDDISRAIANNFKTDFASAELTKHRIGLETSNKKYLRVVIKVLQPIVDEIQKTLEYFWRTKNIKINHLVLVGGTSLLKGLPNYLSKKLKKEVLLGKPLLFNNTRREPLKFVEASGLAIKALSNELQEQDPQIVYELDKEEEQKLKNSLKNKKLIFDFKEQRLKFLLFAFVVSVLLFVGVYVYFRNERNKFQQEKQRVAKQYSIEQELNLKIPVVFDFKDRQDADTLVVRKVEKIIKASNEDEALIKFRQQIEKDLLADEVLLERPLKFEIINDKIEVEKDLNTRIKITSSTTSTVKENIDLEKEYKIVWVIYSKTELNKSFLKAVSQNVKTKFLLKKIKINSLNQDNNQYYIDGQVTIYIE